MVRAITYIILASIFYAGCSDDLIAGRNISPPLLTAFSVEEALSMQSSYPVLVQILADDNNLTDLPSSFAKKYYGVSDLYGLYLRSNRFDKLPVENLQSNWEVVSLRADGSSDTVTIRHSLGIVWRVITVDAYDSWSFNYLYKTKIKISNDYGIFAAAEFGPLIPPSNPPSITLALRLFIQPGGFPIYPFAGVVFHKFLDEQVAETKTLFVNSQSLKQMFHLSFGLFIEGSWLSGFIFVDVPTTRIVRSYIRTESLFSHHFAGFGLVYMF